MYIPSGAIKITDEMPPAHIYEEAQGHWPLDVDFEKGTIFSYYPNIHSKYEMPPDVIAHEMVHMVQQEAITPQTWWHLYFRDEQFRLKQEVEAYSEQYREVCRLTKDRNQRAQRLHQIASFLSGSMYGNLMKYSEAVDIIKKAAI